MVLMLMIGFQLHTCPLQAKTLKIATLSPDGLSWMKKLRAGVKRIERETDGRVKFKIYPGGVQGDDQTVLRKMRIGQLHGGVVAAGSLTRFYPDLQVYSLPMQFRSFEEVDHVRKYMDSKIVSGLDKNGIVSFALTETGFAYILSKRPVSSVGELRKMKAWVPDDDPIAVELLRSFGVSPIPLNLADVLVGLQTGLINLVAVPPIVAIALQWHTQVKYVTKMPILYIYSMLALDKKAFTELSLEDQRTSKTVIDQLFNEVDKDSRNDNLTAYKALLAQGIEEVEPSRENLEEWYALADQSVKDLVANGTITAEIVQQLEKHLAEARRLVPNEINE